MERSGHQEHQEKSRWAGRSVGCVSISLYKNKSQGDASLARFEPLCNSSLTNPSSQRVVVLRAGVFACALLGWGWGWVSICAQVWVKKSRAICLYGAHKHHWNSWSATFGWNTNGMRHNFVRKRERMPMIKRKASRKKLPPKWWCLVSTPGTGG